MSKGLLKDIRFKSEVKSFFSKNKEKVLDIILFGSSVKGKEKPNDIDILILFKDKKDIDISYELKKTIKGFEVSITDKTYKELFEESFKAREAILAEGYSLVYNKFLAEGLGYMNFVLFRYELKGFSKSERMRFYYSLYGRGKDQKGVLEEFNCIKFSDAILLCPSTNTEKLKEYLENWKIRFIEFPILIPSRLKSIL
ncbi:nucleotidyltransferase domain-containing protein [Candidatus Woesearchaeota archaeon]|nr:nucleotidyltransferase domain-containing protein [Candidatus Woesearchaeota archaeon]